MSGSLKEFENWNIRNPIREVTFYDIERKKAWKAALEWVLADLKAARDGFDLGLYDTLKKELNNE